MLDYVPIHKTTLERHLGLHDWLKSWVGDDCKLLDPHGWFTRGHDHVGSEWESNFDFEGASKIRYPALRKGTFMWAPLPCTADVVVEEVRKARHKRQESKYLFVVPRLMSLLWWKQLYKAADLVVTIPCGHPAWPSYMYELLTVAFVFPFLNRRSWQLHGSICVLALERKLSQMLKDNKSRKGSVLRKLWSIQETLRNMPQELAWEVLQSKFRIATPENDKGVKWKLKD